jgi:hypothetical protein
VSSNINTIVFGRVFSCKRIAAGRSGDTGDKYVCSLFKPRGGTKACTFLPNGVFHSHRYLFRCIMLSR